MNSRAKHLPAEERRHVTIEAVVALAGESNPADITTLAIAQRMNLTQGALFRHFPTKDAIWQAVMAWVSSKLLARIEKAAAGVDSPLAAMEAMFLSHIDFVAEHPGIPRMMFGELQRKETSPAKEMARTLLSRYADRLRDQVCQGMAAGEIAPETDPDTAAILFIGLIQGLVMQSMIAGDTRVLRTEAPKAFAIYRRGLAATR
ncbi:TetR/AcrR family transcriptional regulator [Arenimonas alkanexedens]